MLTLPEHEQDTPISGNIQDELNLQPSDAVVNIEEPIVEEENRVFAEGEQETTEDDEIYYLPTNPKPIKETESSVNSSLSSEDLREAKEIF